MQVVAKGKSPMSHQRWVVDRRTCQSKTQSFWLHARGLPHHQCNCGKLFSQLKWVAWSPRVFPTVSRISNLQTFTRLDCTIGWARGGSGLTWLHGFQVDLGNETVTGILLEPLKWEILQKTIKLQVVGLRRVLSFVPLTYEIFNLTDPRKVAVDFADFIAALRD